MAKFCGKCGKPIELCTCGGGGATIDGSTRKPSRVPYSTVSYLDGIALGEGEQEVKDYILGKYPFGCGDVHLIVTNKRVIIKESFSFLFLSHNRVEELNLESVHGINGTIGRGMNKILFFIGVVLLLGSSVIASLSFNRSAGIPSLLLLILGLGSVFLSFIMPYMTFSIIGMGSDHQSLMTGVNVIGKTALNKGVVFQPRPTADTRKSITEAGACIYDLRTYGDEAVKKWNK